MKPIAHQKACWKPATRPPIDLFRHDLVMTLARVTDRRIVEIVDELWLPLVRRDA